MRKGDSLLQTGRDQLQIWIRDEITLLEEIAKGRKMTCRKKSANIKERDTDKEWFKEANIILERRLVI